MTNPPQMLAGACKTGLTKSSYFHVPKSIYAEDKYEDQHKVDRKYEQKHHSRASFHEQEFKPSFGGKTEYLFFYLKIQTLIPLYRVKHHQKTPRKRRKRKNQNQIAKHSHELNQKSWKHIFQIPAIWIRTLWSSGIDEEKAKIIAHQEDHSWWTF